MAATTSPEYFQLIIKIMNKPLSKHRSVQSTVQPPQRPSFNEWSQGIHNQVRKINGLKSLK